MRAAGLAMSVVAVLAGVVVARLEHDREKSARSASAPAGQPPGVDGGAPGRDGAAETPPDAAAVEVRVLPPPSEASRRRRRALEDLLAAQRFAAAAKTGGELIETLSAEGVSTSDAFFADVQRLTAKARVFDILVANIEVPRPRPRAIWVSLANGNVIAAVSARQESDHWVLELPSGISYRPRLPEVSEVREMSEAEHREFVTAEWARIEKRLRGVEDPIELYVRGVERCYRDGLESEGAKLLERLLDVPGSGKIPLRFAGRDAGVATRDWEVAAGRAAGETASREPGTSTPSGQTPRTADATGSPAVLERVRALRDEARELYRRAFEREANTRDLRDARERLDRAFALLDSLESEETVDELRRDLGQILSDVVRVSPF